MHTSTNTNTSTSKVLVREGPTRLPRRRSSRTSKVAVLRTLVASLREAHKAAGEPLPKQARSMVVAQGGSLKGQAHRRRQVDQDRVSRVRVGRRATSGTRKPRRRVRSIRLMGPLRRSREDSIGTRLSLFSNSRVVVRRGLARLFEYTSCSSFLVCWFRVQARGLSFHVSLPLRPIVSHLCFRIRYHTSLFSHSHSHTSISVHSSCTFTVNTLCKIESWCSLRQSILGHVREA
jgi:hypothetical protein